MQENPGATPSRGHEELRLAYRRCVEAAREVSLLVVEPFDLAHLVRTAGVSETEVLGALETALRDLPGAVDLLVEQAGPRLLVLAPGLALAQAEGLARELIAAARKLPLAEGRTVRTYPSIGLAGPPATRAVHFETLLGVAAEGVTVSRFRGGGCAVHTVLYDLIQGRVQRELEASGAPFEGPPVRGSAGKGAVAGTPAPEVEAESLPAVELTPALPVESPEPRREETPELERRVRDLLAVEAERELRAAQDPAPDEGRLRELTGTLTARVLEVLRAEQTLTPAPPPAPGIDPHEVDRLRRRIDKLVRALQETEERLAAAEETQLADSGVASAFRSVQGLSTTARDYELKRGLLEQILEANLALREATRAGRPSASA